MRDAWELDKRFVLRVVITLEKIDAFYEAQPVNHITESAASALPFRLSLI
ncbi:uncharacterized protein CLUP02_10350 [Colletotrichum lupini]|uniref:Uncharacterized protein n=1 Tax=Colletotrichum lupini TaxID=145971 RepID=A0A9Q8SWG2_9PEZI|nr:uncharacterized protein CLUP02_10350 [Colletotrichum lupini]UQC84854.1 hypothetical protein CLUP02_10350 [Colletotrichum lupini]